MINDNIKNQIIRKIKVGQTSLYLHQIPQQGQKEILQMLKAKKLPELAYLSLELFKIPSPTLNGRQIGYFKNSKFIKITYTFNDNAISYKYNSKTYTFDMNTLPQLLSNIATKNMKNIPSLKKELNAFIKTL